METGIKVGECMKTSLVTISGEASVKEAAVRMSQEDITCLLVEDSKKKISAIITESDIVRKCVANGSVDAKAGSVANKPLVTVDEGVDLSEAARLMGKNDVKRLVVTKSGKPCGIISQGDIIRISPSLYDLIAAKAGY